MPMSITTEAAGQERLDAPASKPCSAVKRRDQHEQGLASPGVTQ